MDIRTSSAASLQLKTKVKDTAAVQAIGARGTRKKKIRGNKSHNIPSCPKSPRENFRLLGNTTFTTYIFPLDLE